MEAESYKGYSIWGHAIPEGRAYLASGTILRHSKLVAASEVLDSFATEEEARLTGLNWARAWIDSHGQDGAFIQEIGVGVFERKGDAVAM